MDGLTPDGIQALYQGVEHQARGATGAEAISVTAMSVTKLYCNPTLVRDGGLLVLTKKDLRRDQAEDPLCNVAARTWRVGGRRPC